ncbi:cobalamin-binding protein [Niveibacterium sp. 24ML]|uniref:cobalamin-binding protein n=1 Tax=Niveibacterium sp. 24ML TaxID=2985512 RepID=UPI00226ED94A|nr:cobalamin-binding protein [Niveibacterium sp. 24ML]MCX9155959.1 cobalamin-binding protein [Niveibacterium sp. 24ML]
MSLWLCTEALAAPVSVIDDTGLRVTLPASARRVISLAPHATELLFAAGAGAKVIAATAYSDFPPAAEKLPRVGGYHALDLERIIALKPDLVVGWASGNPSPQLDRLRALGIPVYLSEPREFETIATNLERLGTLTGNPQAGHSAASTLRDGLASLRSRFAQRAPVKVFYQVWSDPLQTLNGKHMVSGVLSLCGGQNVFASLGPIAPTVTHEAVLATAPEAILTGREPATDKGSLEGWKRWPQLPAVRFQNLIYVSGDELNRPGPRILAGANEVCTALDQARARMAQAR